MITIRSATIRDALRLYVWRNHPTTRAMFRNTAPISWESHVEWLKLALFNLSRILYIVERDDDPVGTARLDLDGVEAEVSVTIAPEARGAGIGTEALRLLRDEAFESHVLQRLVARIKVENGASIKAFERAGFVERFRTETEVTLIATR